MMRLSPKGQNSQLDGDGSPAFALAISNVYTIINLIYDFKCFNYGMLAGGMFILLLI